MTSTRLLRGSILVAVSCGLGAMPPAALAGPPQRTSRAAARQRFAALVARREGTVPDGVAVPPRRWIVAFERRIKAYIRHNGLRPIPVPRELLRRPLTPAMARRVQLQREYILEFFRRETRLQRDLIGGGLPFGTLGEVRDATAVTPVRPINVFSFFPAFRN